MARILIVDDENAIRSTIQQFMTRDGHDASTAESAEEAISMLEGGAFDVVISDIVMPKISGVELLKRIQELSPNTKVILITGEPSVETATRAVRLGAFDYLSKPVMRQKLCKTVSDAARFKALEDDNRRYQENLEELIKARTEKLRKTMNDTVAALAYAMEMRDPYTAGHQRRVSEIAMMIAREMKLPEDMSEGLRLAGLLHDIGKLLIPAEILAKPTRLSKAEFELVRCHSEGGYDILKQIEFPWPIADIVYQHHERMDGTGYPNQLAGDQILMEARILAVSDVLEAMASHRPYRPALGLEKAMKVITEGRGISFDARVVDACVAITDSPDFNIDGIVKLN